MAEENFYRCSWVEDIAMEFPPISGKVNYPALTGGAFKDPKTISTVCSARDDDIEYIYGSLPR